MYPQLLYNTVYLYPGFPQVPPAPGIVQWVGYTVPPSSPSPPQPTVPEVQEPTVEELLKSVPVDNVTIQGASAVIAETGAGILDDDGQDPGQTVKAIIAASPKDIPPPLDEEEIISEAGDEQNKDVTCGDEFNYNNNLSQSYRVRDLSLVCTYPHRIKDQHGLTREDIVCNLKSVSENI